MTVRKLCGAWMNRAGEPCARPAGHNGDHYTAAAVTKQRESRRAYDLSPRGKARHASASATPEGKAKDRATRVRYTYGLTPELRPWLLESSEPVGTCAIAGCPETDTSQTRGGKVRPLDVDHDHACCPGARSCGKCVRGLCCTGHNNGLNKVDAAVAVARDLGHTDLEITVYLFRKFGPELTNYVMNPPARRLEEAS